MTDKTIFIKNQSRRLYVIQGIDVLPTSAVEFPASAAENIAVKLGLNDGELRIVDEAIAPILTEDAAKEESERRKKEGFGNTPKRNTGRASAKTAD